MDNRTNCPGVHTWYTSLIDSTPTAALPSSRVKTHAHIDQECMITVGTQTQLRKERMDRKAPYIVSMIKVRCMAVYGSHMRERELRKLQTDEECFQQVLLLAPNSTLNLNLD